MGRFTVEIEGSFYFLLAFILLFFPFPWVVALILAVLVHECFHAAALALVKGRIYSLCLGSGGIRMKTDALTPWQEMACSLAGPLGSAVLLIIAPWMPRTAICGAIHCIYNLLPLFPLDGGRVLRSMMQLLAPGRRGEKIFSLSQNLLRMLLGVFCLWGCIRWGSVFLPVLIVFFWRNRKKRTV